ncbi:MAG: undecaprenyl-diphosphate phosphatase [Solirubrobacterales bacterium]
MTPLQAVVLSLVQALTEFLPISSSGHLILVPYFLKWPDQGLSFDIATNTGTLLAVILFFRRDLRQLVTGFFTGEAGEGDFAPRPLAWAILLATIPAGIAGLLLHHTISAHARNPLLIAGTTIGYGLLLLFADRIGSEARDLAGLKISDAMLIGLGQALALVPGTSRSGITITIALLLGFTRSTAARFSFLLAVPVGVLATLYQIFKYTRGDETLGPIWAIAIAVVVSGIAGYLVIGWLLAWIRRQRLTVFVVYRLLLGAVILATVWARGQ